MTEEEDKRRRYKFSYGDVAELRGVSVFACRKYFSRHDMLLDKHDAVGNLRKVVRYARSSKC